MKKVSMLVALVCFGSALCLAETWTGKLQDAACLDRQSQGGTQETSEKSSTACAPMRSTTTFAIVTSDGRVMKLDSTGNAKAAEMVRGGSSAGSSSKMSSGKGMMVVVSGTADGRVIKVDTIELQ